MAIFFVALKRWCFFVPWAQNDARCFFEQPWLRRDDLKEPIQWLCTVDAT